MSASYSDHAIELIGLRKEYRSGFWMRRFLALKELSLTVGKGEAFGFVGPNGAGKTTTIKILAGLQDATSGEAFILGKSVRDPLSRFRLGFLPERPYFYTHLTAREVLHFYGALYEIPTKERALRIEELLEKTDMMRFANISLGQYSKGMLQRIGLCQTLIHDPDVIVLDEPMSGLDPIGRALVRDIILEERARGKTIFFSSHVLSDVESICTRVAVLVQGELRGVGTIDELLGGKEEEVDVVVRGDLPSEEELCGVILSQEGGKAHIRCTQEQRAELLSVLIAYGVDIVEVSSARKGLEAFLVDEIQKEKPVDARKLGVLV